MEEIIKVENLCFEYEPGLQTINNISFQIHKGEYVAILGHNGSGKSTIAKLLIGLLEKKSGEIYIDDYQLNLENLYKIREKVGIIFQNPDNQFIGATVRDDIAFGLENICVPREQMDELINRYSKVVRMENFLDHEPTKLSGGQKQRVAIAGILAMSPSIIILDEATSMLDPRGRKEINELVFNIYEIKDYNYSGVELWENIFENIYLKKGVKWLTVIEPFVEKLSKEYELPRPRIFKSKLKNFSLLTISTLIMAVGIYFFKFANN